MTRTENSPQSISKRLPLTLGTLLTEMKRYRWAIAGCTLLAAGAGFMSALSQPPTYYSNTLIQLRSQSSGIGENPKAAKSGMQESNKQEIANRVLLHSRALLYPVIDKLNLGMQIYTYMHPVKALFLDRDPVAHNLITLSIPHAYQNKKLDLYIDENSQLSLKYKKKTLLTGDARQKIVSPDNQFVIELVPLSNQTKPKHYTIRRTANPQVFKDVKKRLQVDDLAFSPTDINPAGILQIGYTDTDPNRAVHFLNTLSEVAQTHNLSQKRKNIENELLFLEKEIDATRSDLRLAQKTFNEYRASIQKLSLEVEHERIFQRLSGIEEQLAAIQVQKAEAENFHTDKHPLMIAIKAKEANLIAKRNDIGNFIKEMPEKDQTYLNLALEAEVKEKMYERLITQKQEKEIIHSSILTDLVVIADAEQPITPIANVPALSAATGGLMGFSASVVLLLIGLLRRRSINNPFWLERRFGIANTAVVPYSSDTEAHSLIRPVQNVSTQEALRYFRSIIHLHSTTNTAASVVGIHHLSTTLQQSALTVNTAYLAAQAGIKTLLIDADLRQGPLRDCCPDAAYGLSDLLRDNTTTAQAIIQSKQDNLSFLPAGTPVSSAAELLMEADLEQLMASLQREYDLIIISTAPLLAYTDAIAFALKTTQNYLCLNDEAHLEDEVRFALTQFSQHHITLNGYLYIQSMSADANAYSSEFSHRYISVKHDTKTNVVPYKKSA